MTKSQFAVVPITPTSDMERAALEVKPLGGPASPREIWAAMILAAGASEGQAEPIYQECINENGLWMDTSKQTYDDIISGKLSSKGVRIVYQSAELTALRERIAGMEMLGYELDGVLIDAKNGRLDEVCMRTIERVRNELAAIAKQDAKEPPPCE